MTEKDLNNMDEFFKKGLENFESNPGDSFWKDLKDDLSNYDRYHHVDDSFHEKLSEYGPKPPAETWSRIKNELETPEEYILANNLAEYEPAPPDWIWKSIQYLLWSDQKRKKQNRLAWSAFAAAVVFIGALYISWPESSTKVAYDYVPKYQKGNSNIGSNDNNHNGTNSNDYKSFCQMGDPNFIIKLNSEFKTADGIKNSSTPKSSFDIISDINPETPVGVAYHEELLNIPVREQFAFPKITTFKPEIKSIRVPPTPKNTSTRFSFSLLASQDISFRKLSSQNHDDYQQIRQSSEQAARSYSFVARVNYHINRWKFSTGLNYMQRGENASYNFKTYKQVNTDIQFYNQGTYTYFKVPYPYTLTYDHQKIANNRFTYIEVPVRVSFQLNKNKLTFAPSLAMNVGYMVDAKGVVLSPTNDPVQLSLNNPDYETIRRGVLSSTVSLEIQYPISKHLSITLEPFYNRTLSNFIKNDEQVHQKYYNRGVLGGLTYKL